MIGFLMACALYHLLGAVRLPAPRPYPAFASRHDAARYEAAKRKRVTKRLKAINSGRALRPWTADEADNAAGLAGHYMPETIDLPESDLDTLFV